MRSIWVVVVVAACVSVEPEPDTRTGKLSFAIYESVGVDTTEGWLLRTSDGEAFEVELEQGTPALSASGSTVTASGRIDGTVFHVSDWTTVVPARVARVGGPLTVLVVPVNFLDTNFYTHSPLKTPAQVAAVWNDPGNSIAGYWNRNSQGRVQPVATVVDPPIQIQMTAGLNHTAIAAAVESALTARGIAHASYDARMYMPALNWWPPSVGTTVVGDFMMMFHGTDSVHALGHELGHELRLHHSAIFGDLGYPFGPPLPLGGTDIMGYTQAELNAFSGSGLYSVFALRDLNGAHRSQLGWANPGQIIDVPTGSSSWVISASDEYHATAPVVLKIRAPLADEFYYVSLRHGPHLGSWLNDRVEVTRSQQNTIYFWTGTFLASHHHTALASGGSWCGNASCTAKMTVNSIWRDTAAQKQYASVTVKEP